MDFDGYRIVSVYKPPPARLQAYDLPMFPHPFSVLAILIIRMSTEVMESPVPMESALLLGQALTALSLSTTQRTWPPFILATGTLTPDLTFFSVGPDSRVPDKRILEKFSRSQHRTSLIVPSRLALPVPSKPVDQWNFRKANWSHYNALTNKVFKSSLPPDSLDVDLAYQNFCNAIKTQHPKILSHAVVEISTYRVGMQSARTSTGHLCIRLKEATLTELPLPCSSGSTRNKKIDGLRQLRLSTFRTLVEKRGVYRAT